ncbi:MAG TPA: hypothetical protein VGA96_11470 [Fibrella sp.]|jgi:hypothetical protein
MDFEKVRHVIKDLADEWTKAQLSTEQLDYSDYISALSGLYAVTANLDKTAFVFRGVLQQATRLGRSARWVERELKFEADALATGDRQKLMLYYVHNEGEGSDASLDLYQERLTRFK